MSEWKRVFFDRKRAVLFLLITVLCTVFFATSLVSRLEPGAVGDMIAAQKAVAELYSECKDRSYDEIASICAEYESAIYNYTSFFSGALPPEESDSFKEAEEAVAVHFPRFLSLGNERYAVMRFAGTALSAVYRVRNQAVYLSGYADYLNSVNEQAKKVSGVGIFQKSGGYTSKNIEKTAEDFSKIDGTKVSFDNSISFENWLGYDFADYFFLAMIIIIVLSFLDERKNGLWHTVRSCKNGRAVLGFTRVGILFAGSLVSTVLVYAIPLAVSCAFGGGLGDLGRPIQSLESFKLCSAVVTVGEWLCGYFALKVFTGILIGLFLWCILGSLANAQFSLGVLGTLLVGEYVLNGFIPAQSSANVFKYLNLFSYVRISGLYTDYFNLNVFGTPINARRFMLTAAPVLAVCFALWAILMQAKRRPEGSKDILSKISSVMNRFADVFRARLTVGGWELYKWLIYEFGIIIIVAVVAVGGLLGFRGIVDSSLLINGMYGSYCSDAEGVIDGSEAEYFERARESALSSFNAGESLQALDMLEHKAEEIKQRAAEGGFEPWIVYDVNYDIYFGSSSFSVQRLNAAAAIFFTVFLTAAVFVYERQTGVEYMLRSLKRGRNTVFARKVLISVISAAISWAAVYMRELSDFIGFCHPKTFDAPVRNIDALAGFPLNISVAQYLIILYAVRLIMLIFVSFVVLLLSRLSKNILGAYLLGTAVLVLPPMFTVLGLDAAKYFSFTIPVSSAEIMWKMGDGSFIHALPWIIAAAVGIAAAVYAKIKWCGKKRLRHSD